MASTSGSTAPGPTSTPSGATRTATSRRHLARYPGDTLTNTVTGRSIVVRGEFQETVEPIAGTNEFTRTITGFRYMVTEPGTGVTISDVGRIVYGDPEQTVLLWEAGQHDLVFGSQFDGVFCGALS